MSRYMPLSFASGFALCLALPVLPICARAQTVNANPAASAPRTPQTGAAAQRPGTAAPAKSAKSKAEDRAFKDVPADSPLYAAVADLQRQGVVVNYPEGYFRGRRPLTY